MVESMLHLKIIRTFNEGKNLQMKFRLIVLSLALILMQCRPSAELSANERTQRLLVNKNWDMTIVTVDGIVRNIYSGLSIKFQQSVYTSENGLDVFPDRKSTRLNSSH